MLEYVVRLLGFHGITDLTFQVDFKAEQVVGYGYVTDAFWHDIGTTEAHEKLALEIVENSSCFCAPENPEVYNRHYKGRSKSIKPSLTTE